MIKIKRVYEKSAKTDGKRILVDRLWPRGISKKDAEIHLWAKEIAPSSKLRKWFAHDPKKWKESGRRYQKELKANNIAVQKIISMVKSGKVTLVYFAKDEQHNNAIVLKKFLEKFI